jgi:hypothetical protein
VLTIQLKDIYTIDPDEKMDGKPKIVTGLKA